MAGSALHVLFAVSLHTHWLDPFFLEAMKAYGQAADYFGIHQAGRNLLDGLSIYDSTNYRGEAVPTTPYLYFYRYLPPTAYGATLGAALFDPWTGYWIWVAVNQLLLGLLLLSLWRFPGAPRPVREALVGLTLGFSPFYLEQWMGQYSLLMAAAVWLALRGEMLGRLGVWPLRNTDPERDGGADGDPQRVDEDDAARDARSTAESDADGDPRRTDPRDAARTAPGRALRVAEHSFRALLRSPAFWGWTASLAIKSFTLLFAVVYVLQGRWRRLVLAGAVVGLAILPYFLARPEDLVEFLRLNLKPYPPQLLSVRYGFVSVVQLLSDRLLSSSQATFDLGAKVVTAAELPVYLWIVLVGLLSLFVSLRTFRRARGEHLLVLWILAFFIVYKDIWEYHHVMLLPAIWVFALGQRSRLPWVLFVWLALPTANVWAVEFWRDVPMETWSLLQAAIHHGSYALPVGILYVWTVWLCETAGRREEG